MVTVTPQKRTRRMSIENIDLLASTTSMIRSVRIWNNDKDDDKDNSCNNNVVFKTAIREVVSETEEQLHMTEE